MMKLTIVVPGRVQSLRVIGRGSYHVTLRWAVPAEPNGILTGYIIGYRLGERLTHILSCPGPGGDISEQRDPSVCLSHGAAA